MKVVYLKKVNTMDDFFKEKYQTFPRIIKSFIYFFIYTFHFLWIMTYDNIEICILPYYKNQISKWKRKKIAKKLYSHYRKEKLMLVCSDKIMMQEELKQDLEKYHHSQWIWSEGKWLFPYLLLMLEYISKIQNLELNQQKVDILVNETSDLNWYSINLLATKVKKLKIITPEIYKFRKLEEQLYDEYGIAIELSNNKKKSLSKSHLIINMDFSEELLNQYKINTKAIIINVREKIKIHSIQFSGINVSDYRIAFGKEIQEFFKQKEVYHDFNPNRLYESYLYRIDQPKNLVEQIKEDKVSIVYLIGNKGKINEAEFKNLFHLT